MNLNTIAIAPHATGFIKVASEDDPLFGEGRTKNEFVVTSRHHEAAGDLPKLAPHPVAAQLATDQDEGPRRITEIPIKLYFNKTANALSIRYQAYETGDKLGRPVCAGDGKNAKRLALAADRTPTLQDVACPGPEACEFVASGTAVCRRQVRMPVQIDGHDDPLSVFEVRTSSINAYRALRAQLQQIERMFAGLRHVPLKLTLWQTSNEASGFQPFSVMQLALNSASVMEAMSAAKAARQALADAGIDDDMDAVIEQGDPDDTLDAAAVDFPAVSEFYAAAARRQGAEAITNARVARTVTASTLKGMAANAIAEAVGKGAVPAAEVT